MEQEEGVGGDGSGSVGEGGGGVNTLVDPAV